MNNVETTVKDVDFKKSLKVEVEVKNLSEIKTKLIRFFKVPSKATFYQIIWLKSGKATMQIDFKPICIEAGELLIISTNQICTFDLESEYEGKMILFTDSFFNQSETDRHFLHTSEILNPNNLNQTIRLDSNHVGQIINLLEKELDYDKEMFRPCITQSYLRSLLLEAERWTIENKKGTSHLKTDNISRLFCEEVEKNFKEHKQIEFYFKKLPVGEKKLTKEIKQLTGKTPKKYIESRIILEAKRLLAYSSSSVKEISFELGFEEATNFNKFFRKQTGFTPLFFREKNKS